MQRNSKVRSNGTNAVSIFRTLFEYVSGLLTHFLQKVCTCEILVSCTINAMYLALAAMVQKMELQTKIANKEKKMYAITLWNIFIFILVLLPTSYLLQYVFMEVV